MKSGTRAAIAVLLTLAAACGQAPIKPAATHIREEPAPPGSIPPPVQIAPVLPKPEPSTRPETYSVVVSRVPAQELLFALARDARLQIDIDPSLTGLVTLNAVDQTLPQLLTRIARQIDMRYEFDGQNLVVLRDAPFLRSYKIDYLSANRNVSMRSTASTQFGASSGTAGGAGAAAASTGATSTIEVTSQASYTTGTGADVYTMRESMRLPPSALATYAIDTDEAPSGLSHIDGTGALIAGELSDFTVSNYQPQYQNNCLTVSNVTPMGGQFGMASLGFRPKTAPDGSPGDLATRAQVGDFFLVPAINPNLSQHVISERDRDSNGVCSGTPRVSTVVDSWTTRGFSPWLSALSNTSADSYISNWTIVGGEVMATKNVPQWSNADGESFSGTFTLHHAPDPN